MQNISLIKQRILQFADSLGITRRDFYKKTGISRGTLESKTGITEETLTKFIETYQNVSLIWLIKGDGSMTNEDNYTQTHANLVVNDVVHTYNKRCKQCERYLHDIARYLRDIERYEHNISELKEKLNALQHQDKPLSKRNSA